MPGRIVAGMKLEIPEGHFAGYIFDCDGTIADTMPIHYRAWKQTLKEEGADFPEDLFYSWGGRPGSAIVAELNERCGLAMDITEVIHRKEKHFLDLLHEVEPIEPVIEIARRLEGSAPLAVASGGLRELVRATLETLGVAGIFQAIVCAEDYERGKPAPDPFLEAARRIDVPPSQCLVFEDSPTGIEAAVAAGMAYVFVPSAPHHR